jgi:hypothetical protein
MIVYTNPVPYVPPSLDTIAGDAHHPCVGNNEGVVGGEATVPSATGRSRAAAPRTRSRHARPDADLLSQRLRTRPWRTTSSSRPRTRTCWDRFARSATWARSSRTRRRTMSARPIRRRRRQVGDQSRLLAVGQFPARFSRPRFNQDEAGVRSTTRVADDRRRPARPQRPLRSSRQRRALLRPARDARPGGRVSPDPVRGLPAKGSSIAAAPHGTCPKIVETVRRGRALVSAHEPDMVGRPPTPTSR